VEPEGYKTDYIAYQGPGAAKCLLEEECTGCGGKSFAGYGAGCKVAGDFSELHLAPELNQVEYEESNYYYAENEHVLRCPFNLGLASCNFVGRVTASLTVLNGQPCSIADVEDYAKGQNDATNERIPVSAEELTDDVIG
jgi:hypothetical protein